MKSPPVSSPAVIGVPGLPWGDAERLAWRTRQTRHRSYEADVLRAIDPMQGRFDVLTYGELVCGEDRYPLRAVRSPQWVAGLPGVLVTGGVHGYETGGVHGALRFLDQCAQGYSGRVNWLVVPCVSPWSYEHIQRWNRDAVDPNRSFRQPGSAPESAALMSLVGAYKGQLQAHIDLHETTDSDETEFRPALAARDGLAFEAGSIPDGFYLVDDSRNPQPAFQQAIIDAVERVTPVALPDHRGQLIGSPMVARGVIHYDFQSLGLCAGITGARYTTTTEVYPDSPRATPEQCVEAQVASIVAALDFVIQQGG
ncbi:peptidase [Hydrogenophaga crassostreae]|uniref:Peptidase n=1 Tax=Hydrogenophaga crassostreae TaxID=1763535 RepID=A0A162W3I5_9BURK|nr:M14 family metallocarboxypeptidase [Hydrogenophaga crassostreae]AOW14398.1 peptidase [Hydrogenophaga crassostreae]OAD43577.1 peptidase [Hydrogenophaga crassostreae]